MTRARALKHVIRARAAKTGERYTTARRHVLKSLEPVSVAPRPSRAEPAPRAEAARRAKGMSDARFREKTGYGLDHWFAVLDQFGAVEKGHTAAARHLYEAHGVDGWYAQGITVAYERARGVRAVNQRCDGWYEVSVSKIFATDTSGLVKALTDRRSRERLAVANSDLTRALWAALDSPASKGFVVRPDGQARYRYKWGDSTVQLHLYPKPGGKVSLVVTNAKLQTTMMVEERRTAWRGALNTIASEFASKTQRRRA